MSNICPSCNKFASLELEEPELLRIDIDPETGEVSLEVLVLLTSSCCGEEMKQNDFDADGIVIDGVEDHIEAHKAAGDEYTLEVDADLVPTERTQTLALNKKTKKMVPIKNLRYAKTYKGYSAAITVECSCGSTFEGEYEDDEQSSAFEELNF